MTRWDSAGSQSRGAEDQGAIWGGFLLVPFLCPYKEKEPRVQGRSHPQVAVEFARKARDTFKSWVPAFAGMTDNLNPRFRENNG
jgi:hypothetical protein